MYNKNFCFLNSTVWKKTVIIYHEAGKFSSQLDDGDDDTRGELLSRRKSETNFKRKEILTLVRYRGYYQ